MDKVLSFIVNDKKELLLLKGSSNDPQFKKSFWYVVTGGCEKEDATKEDTVIREIKEEIGINTINNIIYLNWIFKYNSLGKECTEYVYIAYTNSKKIILNEENIDYKWCSLKEFIELIQWFGDKKELEEVLKLAIEKQVYFQKEKIEAL